MREWKEYQLGEIATVQTGPFGSQLHMHDYVTDGTPIITVEHLGDNKVIHSNLPLVSDEDKERLKKYTLREGDIVFSRVGSVDRRAYVSNREQDWMFSGRCLRVRSNSDLVNGKFLSYFFGLDSFKEHIRMVAVGATMPSINTGILSDVVIMLPPLTVQEAIADVLSSLDDKIDLLHRNNRTLEQIAETLFRHRHSFELGKGRPSFIGDLFVDTIGGEWGKETPDENNTVKVKCIRGTDIGTMQSTIPSPPTRYVTSKKFERCRVRLGDIVIEISGGTDDQSTGRAYFFNKINIELLGNDVVFSNFCRLLRPKREAFTYFLYSLLRYIYKRGDFFNLENGTSGIRNLDLNGFLFQESYYLPEVQEIDAFSNDVAPLFDKISFNLKEIQTLQRLRDTLLPKLMNGEVRVTL